MKFKVLYEERVVAQDIPRLGKKDRETIRRAINNKLTEHPEVFGKPLRKSLRGYRSLRVGDYRVIFLIEGSAIKIFAIGHRSWVYDA